MGQSVFVPAGFRSPAFVRDLLQKWLDLLEFYENSGQEPDVAYWYGEVSLTGLLAAAAWKLEAGWSLLEFGAKQCALLQRRNQREPIMITRVTRDWEREIRVYEYVYEYGPVQPIAHISIRSDRQAD